MYAYQSNAALLMKGPQRGCEGVGDRFIQKKMPSGVYLDKACDFCVLCIYLPLFLEARKKYNIKQQQQKTLLHRFWVDYNPQE